MNTELLQSLKKVTAEEQAILDGSSIIQKDLYSSDAAFVIDNHKLLDKNKLIEVRTHTRFIDFPNHKHNYVEMIYMCSGTTTHIVNGKDRIFLKQGDILLLNQNASHEILRAGYDDIAVNFIILPEFFDVVLKIIDDNNILFNFMISVLSTENEVSDYLLFQVNNDLPIQNIMENLIWTLLNNKKQSNTINQVSVGLLFLNLQNFANTINNQYPTQHDQNIVFQALQYIRIHYRNAALDEFCREVQLKTYTVSRMLKKYTGKNFKQLLTEQKLSQAAYLLSRTELSIEAILHAIGYENSSFFYNKFRELYGTTPSNYRMSAAPKNNKEK